MNHLQFQTTIGTIAVTWSAQGLLKRIDWYHCDVPSGRKEDPYSSWAMISRTGIPTALAQLLEQLKRYFQIGEPLGALPWEVIDQRGWTDFQKRVYKALTDVPHGETRTYAWLARRTGKPTATRAVGQALRKNPLPILIPCHRVVSGNDIGGFMGSNDPDQPELRLKKSLIELESNYCNPVFSFLVPSHQQIGVHSGNELTGAAV